MGKQETERISQILWNVHPVDVLRERLDTALRKLGSLIYDAEAAHEEQLVSVDGDRRWERVPRNDVDPDFMDEIERRVIPEAHRAVTLALSATYGISRWLDYGLGDKAGDFETKLRNSLVALRLDVNGMPNTDVWAEPREHWETTFRALEQHQKTLDGLALKSNPPDPKETRGLLEAFNDALDETHKGMGLLREIAEDTSSNALQTQFDYVQKVLIPALWNHAALVLPRMSYATESVSDPCELSVDVLTTNLRHCARRLYLWGRRRRSAQPDAPAIPPPDDAHFSDTRALVEGLLQWLDGILTATAAGGDPGAGGRKSSGGPTGEDPSCTPKYTQATFPHFDRANPGREWILVDDVKARTGLAKGTLGNRRTAGDHWDVDDDRYGIDSGGWCWVAAPANTKKIRYYTPSMNSK